MKPGDTVRVRVRSIWRPAFGDAIGIVASVTTHTRLAWVDFAEIGLQAQGLRWEEFEPAAATRHPFEGLQRPIPPLS